MLLLYKSITLSTTQQFEGIADQFNERSEKQHGHRWLGYRST